MPNQLEKKLSDKAGVIALMYACKNAGISDVVICPGSRNAPMTISFHQSGLFNCHSLADERAAAFFAMGMAISSKRPVAVICTSGSALLNFAPAMAEAFYQKVPLIAISADRPLEWTDQGNGQTIRQEGVLDHFCLDAISIKANPKTADEAWYNKRRLSEGFNKATRSHCGPLHINVPLAEPLYNQVSYHETETLHNFELVTSEATLPQAALEQACDLLADKKRILILVGQQPQNKALDAALNQWAKLPQVVILTETLSNVDCPEAIDTIDRLVMSIQDNTALESMMPDVLISMGGYIVSKKIKALLRQYPAAHHLHISKYVDTIDTYQCLSQHLRAAPGPCMQSMAANIPQLDSDYAAIWKNHAYKAEQVHSQYMADMPYSDFYVFKAIFNAGLNFQNLHLSNSSPVRYAQLFGNLPGVRQYGNRGTSGIDGCSSTAAGIAQQSPAEQHLLITGDVAFKYDINALWNKNFPENLKIIVVNNGGGGIFRIIEGPSRTEELEEFFEADHPVDIEFLARAYGFQYIGCSDSEHLNKSLADFAHIKGKTILEIKTPKELNDGVLKEYFKKIGAQISGNRVA